MLWAFAKPALANVIAGGLTTGLMNKTRYTAWILSIALLSAIASGCGSAYKSEVVQAAEGVLALVQDPRRMEPSSPTCRPAVDGIAGVSWLQFMQSVQRHVQELPGQWRREYSRHR